MAQVAEVDTVILDCDGVIWHANAPIDGSVAAITALRAAGKRVLFVTNSSSQTRAGLAAKLSRVGVTGTVAPEDVVTAASALALYAKQHYPTLRRVMLLGSQACREELAAVNITVAAGGGVGADGTGDAQHAGEAMTEAAFAALEAPAPEHVGGVVAANPEHFPT